MATTLQNSGFATALVNIKEPKHEHFNAVFWFNILAASVLYLILFFCAPLIAKFYNQPLLTPLARYTFLSIIFAALGTAQNAWLFKNLRAKQQAKAAITATILSSLTGVTMALLGCGYYALATQSLIYVLTNSLLAWHYSPWRPTILVGGRWQEARGILKDMLRFSYKLVLTSILTIINNNVLNILLGRWLGTYQTGIYNQAYQWNFKSYNLVQNMTNQVAQPVLVEMRDDPARQLNAFRQLVRFTAATAIPLMILIAVFAKPLVHYALTDKWLECVPLLQILCISGACIPLSTLLSNLIISLKRSDLYLYITLALLITQLAALTIVATTLHSTLNTQHLVITFVITNSLFTFIWFYAVHRLTHYPLHHFLIDIILSPYYLIKQVTKKKV